MANLTDFMLERIFGAPALRSVDTTTGGTQPQTSTQVEKPGPGPAGPHGSQMFRPVTDPIMPTATMPKASLPSAAMPQVPQAKTPYAVRTPDQPPPGGTQKRSGYVPAVDTKDISSWDGVPAQAAFGPAGIGATQAAPLPLAQMAKSGLDFAEETNEPIRYIPSYTDEGGTLRIRSGISHDEDYERYKDTGAEIRTPSGQESLERFTDGGILGILESVLTGQETLDEAVFEPLMSKAEVVNDINTRVGNLRKWWAGDDPFTSEDDRALMITLPNGNTWRAPRNQQDQGHVTTYRSLADGTVLSDGQLVNDVIPINNGADGYRLPDGRVVDAAVVADPKFHHSAFPDGTIYMNADASLSPEVREAYTKQIGTDEMDVPIDEWDPKNAPDGGVMGGSGFLNLGVADPRAPWENERGDFILESDYWDESPDGRSVLERSAIDEMAPWMLDMTLNSAPYYVPGYNLVSGASAALPYLFGYDGESYMPEGSGLSQLDKLGEGTYRYDELSNAQRAGGFLSPLVEAYVERLGGTIGGLGDIVLKGPLGNTRPGKWLKETPFGKFLMDAGGEGAEELLTAPLDKLKTEGMRNYGRDYYLDNTTGELVFDGDTSTIDRIMSLGTDELKAFLSGTALGGSTSLVTQGLSGGFRRNPSIPEVPSIPRATPEELRQMEEEYSRRHAPTED